MKIILALLKKLGRLIGLIQTNILLFVVYFIGIGLTALFAFIFRMDLLGRRRTKKASYWRDREKFGVNWETCKRQF